MFPEHLDPGKVEQDLFPYLFCTFDTTLDAVLSRGRPRVLTSTTLGARNWRNGW